MPKNLRTISPIDNRVYVERPFATQENIDQTLAAAIETQKEWQRLPLSERKIICSKAIDAFVANSDKIAEEICWQMGRPIKFAAGEIAGMVERARTMIDLSEQGLADFQPGKKQGFERWVQREALGTVFVIAPWNYPYLTSINAIMPALLAGNAVVLKHSAQTPLCAERLVEAFKKGGLPEGVFEYLHLNHADTEQVISDRRIDFVAFTGSVPGGEMVEKAAAGRFIGVGLELGGKDPAYIRKDADLAHAIETSMDGAFFNSGQSCCGIERIYVHETVYDAYLEEAIAWVKTLKLGASNEQDTTLGPMVRASAADFVRGQIAEAITQGATAHLPFNTHPLDETGSAYLSPQILSNVNHDMRVMTEESFGPVVGIQKARSDEEAIALMNDSNFGLTASVFTQDIETGIKLGQQIKTGTFFINRCDYLDPELAWTGIKNSGRGCTLSVMAFDSFTRPKSFHIKTTTS